MVCVAVSVCLGVYMHLVYPHTSFLVTRTHVGAPSPSNNNSTQRRHIKDRQNSRQNKVPCLGPQADKNPMP